MNTPNTYDRVTATIIAALERGTIPCRKPWSSAGLPCNYDGRPYRGINAFVLALAPFEVPVFVTFNRARDLGGTVKKGEHGQPVIFWKIDREQEQEPDGTLATRTLILARTRPVLGRLCVARRRIPKGRTARGGSRSLQVWPGTAPGLRLGQGHLGAGAAGTRAP